MKLSTRTRYGTRAMVEIAKNYGKGPVKRRDITKTQGISHSYLENILIVLKTKGLVSTVRGAEGGFVLEKPPSQITLYEIVTALEGSIAPVDCIEQPSLCARTPRCAGRFAWRKLHEAQSNVLMSITLSQLVDVERDTAGDYVI